MAILVWIVVILLAGIILWLKVNQHTISLNLMRKRLDLLESNLADLRRAMQDLRKGKEPVAPQPAPEPILPPAQAIPPAYVPPKAEPAPAPPESITPTPIPPGVEPKQPAAPSAPPALSLPEIPAAPAEVFQGRPASSGPTWNLPKFDLESLVGVKFFSWVAGVAILLAVIFFLRYSINQGWLMPKVRMTIGLIVGTGLLALCELKAARKYPVTANAMDASAIAILFSTFYAARALWDLIPAVPAFFFMVLVTAVAVLLSVRRNSAFIALLGLLGGFATPALLSTGENSPISLFTYLLLLNTGLAYVAYQKKWPLLTTLSLIFTFLYQWSWVFKFFSASQMPLALGIFIVFPIMAFAMTAINRNQGQNKSWISLYGQTANITALLPLLFTLYLAAVPGYGERYLLLFSFLFLLDAGLFAISVWRGPEILHSVGALSTILVFGIWLWVSYRSDTWAAMTAFLTLFVTFFLAAPLIAQHFNRTFREMGRWAAYAAPLLLFSIPVLVAIEPACANPGPLFGILFLLMLAISGYAIFAGQGPLYFIGSLFALLAEAEWSSRYMNPDRLISGLILYCVFGLLYIGVPVLARHYKKTLRPEFAGAGVILLGIALLLFLASGRVAPEAIWGLALLLLLLNAGLFWHAASSRMPMLAIPGIVLSWVILGVLWVHIPLQSLLMPALVLIAGFALLVLAGSIWMQQETQEALSSQSIFLALFGHLFLAVVAAQRELSIPPWPFLCVLLLLDLAIGFSSLYVRRSVLHGAAMAASAVLLMIWGTAAGTAPWPAVAILLAGALSFFSFAWIYLAGQAGIDRKPFSNISVMTVLLSQFVAIIAGVQSGAPSVGFLVAANLVFVAALLGLAWSRGLHVLAVIAVIPTTLAISLWHLLHGHGLPQLWPELLLFATPPYLAFIAYPLLLGRRSGKSLLPYLAAVVASVPFFFQARQAMMDAGWDNVIGILPVFQALLMGLLVVRLLQIEPRGGRAQGRLAMTAGAALAFVTLAIPLQLEKEWITIGWVLEGAALAWLYGKIPHRGLLCASTGLFAAVFARLALNPFVLTYEQRSDIRIWNWYLYTYVISAAAMILGGHLLSRTNDALFPPWPRVSKLAPAGAIILLFFLLNIEIADFFSTGPTITFNFTATLAQDLTYTLAWALFGVALLGAGIIIRSQPARIASLALLVATIIKCFIHDLARLGELYRIMSFVGLGICLALVALALQKFVLSARKR